MTLHTKKTGRKTDFCKRLAENFFRRGSCEKNNNTFDDGNSIRKTVMRGKFAGRMTIIGFFVLLGWAGAVSGGNAQPERGGKSLRMAVEFMDHAAAAFVCREKGWFETAGLKVESCETYVTGMALAAALAREDIDAAFICLVPAINAYGNAGVGLKIIAGTHKHGYGLVARAAAVSCIEDLQKAEIRLGCVREGGAVDVLLCKTMERYGLDKTTMMSRVQRMSPAKQLLAIQTGQLDAAVLPEQWATMAESGGCRMLLTSRDVWPRMQGSVLVVKERLIRQRPEVVRKLALLLQQATDWINRHPRAAAEIVTAQLQIIEDDRTAGIDTAAGSAMTPAVLRRSMARMDYTTAVDPAEVQKMIDYLARLGYLRKAFPAREILDLRFLEHGRRQ